MTVKAELVVLIQSHYNIYMYVLLIVLILLSTLFFFVALSYCNRLKKAIDGKKKIDDENYDISQQFNSLINSLNDIIFEFDENKVCLNVWFNDSTERVIDPKQTVGKKLEEVIGPEKAKKFNDLLDYVIEHRRPASIHQPAASRSDRQMQRAQQYPLQRTWMYERRCDQ